MAGSPTYDRIGVGHSTQRVPEPTWVEQIGDAPHTCAPGRRRAPAVPGRPFDVAMGTFTVHHWNDRAAGCRELRRVAERQVLVVYEPLVAHRFWVVDHFPEVRTSTVESTAPTPEDLGEHLDVTDVQIMWIPADCCDGVAAAYWRRPEAYLDPAVQRSMSILALLPDEVVARGTARLASDLEDGTWHERHAHLLGQATADYGYRLVVARS